MSETVGGAASKPAQMRLDVWLWRARFFKTRSLAVRAIEKSGARIERDGQVRRIDKPSTNVAVGDLISFKHVKTLRTIEVLALPRRRGPATEAAATFKDFGDDKNDFP